MCCAPSVRETLRRDKTSARDQVKGQSKARTRLDEDVASGDRNVCEILSISFFSLLGGV